jgi:allantoinase
VVIRSRRVVLPDIVRPASIHISNGTITRVADYDDVNEDAIDAGDLVISPGLVDTHVHVNEPGRTEWEGFDTATRAAAAGGVTTIVDMPLNSVPATTTVEALETKRAAARGKCHVDIAFWGGVVPGNAGELDALVGAGVRGFKCFLVPSGVDEFPHVDESDLRQALPVLARRGVPLLVHAESPAVLADVARAFQARDRGPERAALRYEEYESTRPPAAEVEAIRLMIHLAHEFGARVHIVHVASAEATDEIARAKADGVPITAETCPHYLTFSAEEIPDGATEFKCAPPIRDARHREALWGALKSGVLDLVATDHSPAPPSMKCRGDFMRAWGGIASLELSLAALWSARLKPSRYEGGDDVARRLQPSDRNVDDGARRLQASVGDITRWMSEAPARLAGVDDRKGRLAPGYDADVVVWDPDAEFTVDAARLQQRHKLTPYAERRLRGVVHATYLRGELVWDGDRLTTERAGRLL